ncbi:MAG: hypothetical protein DWQ34_09755 [Planctomycetota bacterium]|nr:MAG: hypothetical protein DWQ34_09755 [Planctomycetota bacterium]REJ97304.1 MAG: hypothetical protein DWQ29_00125 [Planctomycetota bacterium]REK24758.1 MAG: hypothetical protein DWQ41_13575 [Planctomycetota bacterium]REK37804.1 MAG: hypothetical protein DWQ45_05850 [Planctomycetota bacterium]
MRRYWKLVVVTAALALALPVSTSAGQFGIGIFGNCGGCGFSLGLGGCANCGLCQPPRPHFACPPPVAPQPVLPPPTSYCPPPQISYRQEQYTTYRDVPRIQHRREAYVEQVPVTTYQQVTQTVYVPQQVTKMVPQTTLQAQTRYRDVAYQVTERIPETHTRLVPEQRFSYAPPTPVVSDCCGGIGSTAYAPPIGLPTAAAPIPQSALLPYQPTHTHVPVPEYNYPAETSWQTVPSRTAEQPTPAANPVRGASLFRPAPTAAAVWQSRF